MSDTKTVYQAWSAVMRAVPVVEKGGYNESQKFAFRGIDDVLNALGPAMRAEGVFVVPRLTSMEYASFQSNRGSIPSVRVIVDYRVFGPAGDFFEGTVAGESMDSGDKATAKAMSVAFRTFLAQAACLPTGDPDPDASTYQPGQKRDRAQGQPQQAQGGRPAMNTTGDKCPSCGAPDGKTHATNCKGTRKADSPANPTPAESPAGPDAAKPAAKTEAPAAAVPWKVRVWNSVRAVCDTIGTPMTSYREFGALLKACPHAWAQGVASPGQIPEDEATLEALLAWVAVSKKPAAAPAKVTAPAPAAEDEDPFEGIPAAHR